MANKKVTITISESALSKIEIQSDALDITPNLYIKQITMQHVNNSKVTFFTPQQVLVLKEFNEKQSQLLNTLRKIDEEYLKKGIHFPTDKLQTYFQNYHKLFSSTIERLSDDN